jgi:hypothetical protein
MGKLGRGKTVDLVKGLPGMVGDYVEDAIGPGFDCVGNVLQHGLHFFVREAATGCWLSKNQRGTATGWRARTGTMSLFSWSAARAAALLGGNLLGRCVNGRAAWLASSILGRPSLRLMSMNSIPNSVATTLSMIPQNLFCSSLLGDVRRCGDREQVIAGLDFVCIWVIGTWGYEGDWGDHVSFLEDEERVDSARDDGLVFSGS